MDQDRRKPWDGSERRGCFYDPETAAKHIAQHLDAYQIERDDRREAERFERFGRAIASKILWLAGAFGIWIIGRKHEALMGFFEFIAK